MILELTGASFTDVAGTYYSPPFKQGVEDTLMTVAVWLALAGTASMQESIDGIDWVDVPDSSISCNLHGLQTFIDCQYDLLCRIKTTQAVTKAKISI